MRSEVRFLESASSTPLGHQRKESKPMQRGPKKPKPEGETHAYDWRDRAGRGHDGKFSRDL